MADRTRTIDDTGKVRVLVYGTLKSTHTNHELMKKIRATFLGYDFTLGHYKLKDLGPFPAVFDLTPKERRAAAAEQPICGEVYMMNEDALAHLDFYEGHPHFFQRRKLWTEIMKKRVWMYLMPLTKLDDPAQDSIIKTGVWQPGEEEENFWVQREAM